MPDKPQDAFARALRCSDLDESLKIITDALGLPGLSTGNEITDQDRKTYGGLLNCYRQAHFLRGVIENEMSAAAERVGRLG